MNTEALITELEAKYNIRRGAGLYLEAEHLNRIQFAKLPRTIRLLGWLREEVRQLLCENSSKYQNERESLKHSIAPVVGLLSSSLAAKFGIEAGAATALAATALFVPLKLSVNAWCAATRPFSQEESTLISISQKQLPTALPGATVELVKKLTTRGEPEQKLLKELVGGMTEAERNELLEELFDPADRMRLQKSKSLPSS